MVRLDQHAVMLGTDATVTAGGNTVGRLGRCQTHLWPAVDYTRLTDSLPTTNNDNNNYRTTIIHEAHRARSKHTGFSSFIALNNFILFHKHFFLFENLQPTIHYWKSNDSWGRPEKVTTAASSTSNNAGSLPLAVLVELNFYMLLTQHTSHYITRKALSDPQHHQSHV